MDAFRTRFGKTLPSIIGMVHLRALPGTPRNKHGVQELINKACEEAKLYNDLKLDGLIVENMHDIPYLHTNDVGPEIVACMSVICHKVKEVFQRGPVGVQLLAGANKQALAVGQAAGLDFIRAEGFVFSHVADEGMMNACAGELLRYRKYIGAENIQIFTDIKKKHSAHSITSDMSIAETAKAAEFFLSDGVIVTGSSTGVAAEINDLKNVRKAVDIPVLIGSGVTVDNVHMYKSASGLIVGSEFKRNGHWQNELDTDRIKKFMEKVNDLDKEDEDHFINM